MNCKGENKLWTIIQSDKEYENSEKLMPCHKKLLQKKVGISTTHMSHIETGNTKLSLAVLVNLSLALDVSTDDLLFDQSPVSKNSLMNKTVEILENCNTQELAIIMDIIKATKIGLSKNL